MPNKEKEIIRKSVCLDPVTDEVLERLREYYLGQSASAIIRLAIIFHARSLGLL